MIPYLSKAFRRIAIFMLASLTASSAAAQVTCLPITQINVEGATLLDQTEIDAVIAPYAGHCLGLEAFDDILEGLTGVYVARGNILSRAYLPEQDLSSGKLRIEVIEGELSDIRVNGEARQRWMRMVFPGQLGAPVDIRDVEQGLDQIQSMPRWQASMDFDVGEAPGQTTLEVTAQTSRRYGFAFSSNNQGNEESGVWNSGISGDVTNVFGLNDTIEVSVGKTLNPGPLSFDYDDDTNRNAGLSIKMPYGRWSFSYDFAWSDYRLTIPGAIASINTDGWTRRQTLSGKYLLARNQTTKQFLTTEVTQAVNENFIQDTLIETSSRTLSDVKVSYSLSHPLGVGTLGGEIYGQRGVEWFSALKAADLPAGSPNPQFFRLGYSGSYTQRYGGEAPQNTWTSTLSGQISEDRLYGAQTHSVGGVSTVRGSRIALASGSTGVIWRNELERQLKGDFGLNYFSLYAALDVGRVANQADLNLTEATVWGGALGLKVNTRYFSFDVSYQEILKVSDGLQEPEGEFFISLEANY